MLLGGLCENLESLHETKNKICHKVIQTALLSFLVNLLSATISPSTKVVYYIFFRMLWGISIPILECQRSLRCKLEVWAEHKIGKIAL
jgi:hypothetical protein